jgi:hypothetical protein
MPYIQKSEREELCELAPETAGQLNYLFTAIIIQYIETKGKSYQTINDIMGALTGAQAEFYRRVVVPYEDLKIRENGDVYVN